MRVGHAHDRRSRVVITEFKHGHFGLADINLKSLLWCWNQCACVDVFDTKVTDVRKGCFPFVLFRETRYNPEIETSGWRP